MSEQSNQTSTSSLPSTGSPGDVRRFNRVCAAFGLALLLVLGMGSMILRHNYFDFPQYYMGGATAREGMWDVLYPIPSPGATRNAGESRDTVPQPEYDELIKRKDIPDTFRFIQPPPAALLYIPLAMLPPLAAHFAWLFAMTLLTWIACVQAGAIYDRCAGGRATRITGVLILLACASPTAVRAIRNSNITPVVAACIGYCVLAFLRDGQGRRSAPRALAQAGAIVAGALAKYATPVLLPLYVLGRRWAVIVWIISITLAAGLITLAVCGKGPYLVFWNDIVPTLNRANSQSGNQSLRGLLLRLCHREVLTPEMESAVRAIRWIVMAGVLALLWRCRKLIDRPPVACAGAAALVAWLLIFGPVVWPHYPLYLFPLWGWLAWAAGRGRAMAIATITAMVLAAIPLSGLPYLMLPEPLNSSMLLSNLLVLGAASIVLYRPAKIDQNFWASSRDDY